MKLKNKTILITGGGSGIGFELAKQLSQQDNKIIICGRNEEKLKKAVQEIQNGEYVVCDVTKESDVVKLLEKITKNFPSLAVLINNAGVGFGYNASDPKLYQKASIEIDTNYLSALRLNEIFLPLLLNQKDAAIVHITSPLALAPSYSLPTYSASKAALHSYTKWLQQVMKGTTVKIFEAIPPVVDTALSVSLNEKNKMTAGSAAKAIIKGIQNDKPIIKIGIIKALFVINRFLPRLGQKMINKATKLK
ncbi:MAG TPA: SDR family NAD(P)-dependent oxidoreductase [Chitinophagaceae bacterium]|jgi:uncharacterized oxidoreductase|nr:SDR family NAD(P)-dependent oxidoreductase [Chitinophagaceae bacterium]